MIGIFVTPQPQCAQTYITSMGSGMRLIAEIQRFAFGKCMLAWPPFRAAVTGSNQPYQVATGDISFPPATSRLDADNRFRAF